MKVFLIGGPTADEPAAVKSELAELAPVCHVLGRELVLRGHTLVLCSPFEDAVDRYAAFGAADGFEPDLEFHYPDHPWVREKVVELDQAVTTTRFRRLPIRPLVETPDPEKTKEAEYSWLIAQLNALDVSAGVIAIGGRTDGVAQLLFRLAAAKDKSILPWTFLGGAAADYFDTYKWDLFDVLGTDIDLLSEKSAIERAPELLERLLEGVPDREEDRFFISYARARPHEADYVETLLRRRNGTVYRDEQEFEPGLNTQEEILKNIRRANVFIAVWCQEYACSPWCFDELELAIERRQKGLLELWIFCVDDTRMVPPGARDINYYTVKSREELEGKLLHLMKRLQRE